MRPFNNSLSDAVLTEQNVFLCVSKGCLQVNNERWEGKRFNWEFAIFSALFGIFSSFPSSVNRMNPWKVFKDDDVSEGFHSSPFLIKNIPRKGGGWNGMRK